jgi:nucleoid DNA-binding protein
MSSPETSTITRAHFVQKFMQDCGLNYIQANRVYDSMVSTIENGVITGAKITFGRVGAMKPRWRNPRVVNKWFEKKPGGVIERCHKEYYLGSRIDYTFEIYKKFINTHELHWGFGGS